MPRYVRLSALLLVAVLIVAGCDRTPRDRAAPVVNITAPADGTAVFAGTTVSVTGTATDDVAVTSLTVSVNDGAADTVTLDGADWQYDFSVAAAGAVRLRVSALDAVGNEGSAELSLVAGGGSVAGSGERIPAYGSGRPVVTPEGSGTPEVTTDSLVGGLGNLLLSNGVQRGDPRALQRSEMPALNRVIVRFAPQRLVLPANAGASQVLQLQSAVQSVAADFATVGVTSGTSLVPALGIAVFDLEPGTDVGLAVASMNSDARFRTVEREHWLFATAAPNDSAFPLQWAHDVADAEVAWSRSTGSHSVRVAVVDTGSAATIGLESRTGLHVDLAPNMIPGFDFVSSLDLDVGIPPQDEVFDQIKARWPQAQYLDADQHPGWDPYPLDELSIVFTSEGQVTGLDTFGSHGTHVAGIIGAVGNNLSGVAGVNWNVEIQPLRALGAIGAGVSSDVLAAVAYAAGFAVYNPDPSAPGLLYNPTPAQIINLSLGGGPFSEIASDLYRAVRNANVLVVAAAGNSLSSDPHYPSGYDGVMSVSSVDYVHWAEDLAGPAVAFSDFFSNYGDTIDISAPGGLAWADAAAFNSGDMNRLLDAPFVISTGWLWYDVEDPVTAQRVDSPILYSSLGTSMASPYVAGAAALLLSIDPGLSADDLEQILTRTASRVDDRFLDYSYGEPDADWDPFFGHGVVNLAAAVQAVLSGDRSKIPTVTYVEAVAVGGADVVRFVANTDLTFELTDLPAGEWLIRAGVDANGNGALGDSGEYYGEFDSAVVISEGEPVTGDVSLILQRVP